jgi:hypothetical protein
MTVTEFKRSVSMSRPPGELTPALIGLWWEAKGDWERAHAAVMDEMAKDFEGDLGNARYWYGQAGKAPPRGRLGAEWDSIAGELLAAPPAK